MDQSVMTEKLSYDGYCPICEAPVRFESESAEYRESLKCMSCDNGSIPRERALALVLNELAPNWRDLKIHECAPIWRGVSLKIARQAQYYLCTQYFASEPFGTIIEGYRNEDLQAQTFADDHFDLFLSLDVMEHIVEPELAFKEIWRTLRPGGMMISTWPVGKQQASPVQFRVARDKNGAVIHLKPPVYHRNLVAEEGSLVTVDYGYDIHQKIAEWAPFDVRVYRFADKAHGILGEHTEVFVCKKRLVSESPSLGQIRKRRK
jgi:SAM-dependent methyltransferase